MQSAERGLLCKALTASPAPLHPSFLVARGHGALVSSLNSRKGEQISHGSVAARASQPVGVSPFGLVPRLNFSWCVGVKKSARKMTDSCIPLSNLALQFMLSMTIESSPSSASSSASSAPSFHVSTEPSEPARAVFTGECEVRESSCHASCQCFLVAQALPT